MLARDWSKNVTWPNISQLKLGNIREYTPISIWIWIWVSSEVIAICIQWVCEYQSTSWILHSLLHRAEETQQGRNSCPRLQFGFPFGLYRVVSPLSFLRSISLASLFTSRSIFGWSDLLQILRIQAAFSFAVLCIIMYKNIWRMINKIASIWGENLLGYIYPWTLSVPRSSRISSSYALGKVFSSRNRLRARTNILAYLRAKWNVYIYMYMVLQDIVRFWMTMY